MTQILTKGKAFKDDQYILATQVKQCFYLEDMARRQPHWKVVEHVNHKKFLDGGVIVVEEDPDVIHFDNLSDLALSTSLNDLDFVTLHIDGQSTDVDAPPDIIDVDEDDDIIDDEDALPHDLADSDDEDLINVDDDDDDVFMSADIARGHGGDSGGDDCPPSHQVPTGCGGCLGNRGKGTRKPNLGGGKAGRLHTSQETQNLGLKKITDQHGPGVADALPFLAPGPTGAEGGGLGKDWDGDLVFLSLQMEIYNGNKSAHKADGDLRYSRVPSLIQTFFQTHIVGEVFLRDEDQVLYEEMLRLQGLGSNTETGVPYTEDDIMAIVRKGKQRRHLPGVGRLKKSNKRLTKQVIMIMKLFRSDDKMSQMLTQLESQPKFGGGSGIGRCGDDESGNDEDDDEDEEDADS
ncbi:hypothetical protein Tco_0467828 [Tanacetum coccineum]